MFQSFNLPLAGYIKLKPLSLQWLRILFLTTSGNVHTYTAIKRMCAYAHIFMRTHMSVCSAIVGFAGICAHLLNLLLQQFALSQRRQW